MYVKGQKIELTTKEFDALYLLIINKRRVMTFETISYHVWGEDYIDVTTQAIHNLMSRLRQKLQTVPGMPDYIIRQGTRPFLFGRDIPIAAHPY